METNGRPRVGIAVPLVALKAKPLISLASALCTTNAQMSLLVTEGAYIPYNRILLVELAREWKCTHIFFMDHDQVFAEDTVTRLLAHDKDIVAAPYNMKQYPLQTTVILLDKNGKRRNKLPKKMFTCEALGCGCMLVKMEVFDKIQFPWFQIYINPETRKLEMSEDVWFCNQARQAGYEIFCDPTIKVGHVGEAVY